MKKLLPITLVALLVIAILPACGVPQEDYDKLSADLAAAQTRIQNLESQLATANDKNNTLQAQLDSAIEEYENLNTEYENLNAECVSIDTECTATIDEFAAAVEGAEPYKNILVELSGPAITGDNLSTPETKSAIEAYVTEAGDETLTAKFENWSNTPTDRSKAYELLWYALIEVEKRVFEFEPTTSPE